MWEIGCNPDNSIEPFAAVLDKDNVSKGGCWDDYLANCEFFKIIRCPHISVRAGTEENTEIIRICNSEVDLSNWRALLLACTVMCSKVTEIYIQNSKLKAQHLLDLSAALAKIGTLRTVKMQFVDFGLTDNEAAVGDAFKALFADSCGLTFISVMNCGLTDAIGQAIAAGLSSNFVLTGLNLSNNSLTDVTLKQIVSSIRYTGNLKFLAMRGNPIEGGDVLTALLAQFIGGDSTAADDAAIKANTKALGDKNKGIKDANKKRKKAGHVELAELSLPELTRKVGKTSVFANQTFELLDIVGNPVSPSTVVEFAKQLDAADAEAVANLPFQLRVTAPFLDGTDVELLLKYERIIKLIEL